MRSHWLAAVCLILTALAVLVPLSARPSPIQADSTPPPDEPHAAVLGSFLSAWQSADIDRVMAHFSPTAAISWASDWSHAGAGPPIQVRAWIQSFLRERGTLAGRLERAEGAHATWRLSRRLPLDIRLGLPPQDSIVEAELRDGRIVNLSEHADPASRQRYSHAVQVLSAQHPAFSTVPRADTPTPLHITTPSPTAWIAAAAACLALTLSAAFARRTRL